MIRCPECKHSFEEPKSTFATKLGSMVGLLVMIAVAWVIILGLYWLTLRVVV